MRLRGGPRCRRQGGWEIVLSCGAEIIYHRNFLRFFFCFINFPILLPPSITTQIDILFSPPPPPGRAASDRHPKPHQQHTWHFPPTHGPHTQRNHREVRSSAIWHPHRVGSARWFWCRLRSKAACRYSIHIVCVRGMFSCFFFYYISCIYMWSCASLLYWGNTLCWWMTRLFNRGFTVWMG